MASQSEVPSQIDKMLNQTEMGAFIAKYKGATLTIIGLIFVGLIGFGASQYFSGKKSKVVGKDLYAFKTTTLKDYNDGKINEAQLVTGYSELADKTGNHSSIAPIGIELSDMLFEKERSKEASEVLAASLKAADSSELKHLVKMRLAVAQEDMGKADAAISTLESMLNSSIETFKGKTYLDLGRLYLAKGDKKMAQRNFEYVVEKSTDEEFKKLARLQLEDLK